MRDLVLLMFVAGTLPMAFMRPIIGLLLWSMFSYLNPHRMTWGFAVGLPWVMLVAVVTFVALAMYPQQRQRLAFKPIVVLMTLFLLWVSIATTQATLPDASFKDLSQFVKMMAMAYVTIMLVTDRQKLEWLIWVIVASFGFWGFKGGLFTLATGGNYHVMGPKFSFFTDNNIFALIMCMTIPLMRYVQLQTTNNRLRLLLWALMGLTAIAVIGTYSRGGMLALAITGAMLIWKSRRRGFLILLVPLFALAVGSFMPAKYFGRLHTIDQYHQDASAQGRIQSWKFATGVAMAHPMVGGGFHVWHSVPMWQRYGPPDAAEGRAIHSIFFEVLGEQGFVGLGLYICLLVSAYMGLARVRKKARAGPDCDWLVDLSSMVQISLVSYVAAGALLPVPYIDFLYQLFAIVVVMQLLVERITQTSERPAKTPAVRSPVKPSTSTKNRRRPPRALGAPGGRARGHRGTQDLPHW